MAEGKLINLRPMSKPDASLLVEIIQGEIQASVDGGTFTEDPQRFEQLAGLQATLIEAYDEADCG